MPLIQTAGLFTAGLLTTTSLFAGATPGSTSGPDDGPRIPCGAVWSKLPADLRADLTAARQLPEGERIDALQAIREDALDGDYGDRVQQFAERREQRVRAVRRLLPADLKVDLRDARDLSGDEQVAAYRAIRDGALAGEYGDRVQQVAETVQQRREACEAS
ncbi:hypothetical protein J2X46_003742 [Nocardioides sp. BE266]|uniref:hypothetical protein n=1 Tax=Nocardioides sp. BE266 TaxID=2817725 RepID=UPI0028648F6C|nr:hypothetical protein [Nocardioides sp. BE266]MDR7254744.1 hypothetical protein [Nocardioides sp. BE266]